MATISEKKLSKRMRILEAAYGLFTDKSVNSTAIDEVVRLAGVAKGTFYLYFKDKYDLLDQIIIYKSVELVGNAFDKLERKKHSELTSFPEQMIYLYDCIIDAIAQNKKLAMLVYKDFMACFSVIEQTDNPKLRREFDGIITACEQTGKTRSEARMTVFAVTDMVLSVCFDSMFGKIPCKTEEMRPMLHSLINTAFSGGDKA